ncbi:DBP [Duck adenovirus 3]|nr:DBP [Duck adenovirus 3]
MAEFIHFEASEASSDEESPLEIVVKPKKAKAKPAKKRQDEEPPLKSTELGRPLATESRAFVFIHSGKGVKTMKKKHVAKTVVSESEAEEEEEEEEVEEVVKVSAKKIRKRRQEIESESEIEEKPHKKRAAKEVEEEAEAEAEEEDEENESPKPSANLLEFAAQKAMGYLTKLCDAFGVKWQGTSIEPTNAVWAKLGSSFMRKVHPDFRLTFSTYESFNCQLGRFVAAMVYNKAELTPKFLPGGVYVWRHGWNEKSGDFKPKCLHGMEMVVKPRTIEMSALSEAGKRAVGENGAVVEKNKYGRSVVIMKFDNNVVCFKDLNHGGFPHPHATGSCAMVFSDAEKAVSAMKHDLMWTQSLYPNVPAAKITERVLIGSNCLCNYAYEGAVPGRQLCKMVPYKMNGTDEISDEVAKARKDMGAHKQFGHTMVYLCCNPQSSGRNTNMSAAQKLDKTCGWKLSAIDLRFAYIFANEIYHSVNGENASPKLHEFKWFNGFAFKTDVIQPAIVQDSTEVF